MAKAVLVKVDHFYLSNATDKAALQPTAKPPSRAIGVVGHEVKSTDWAVKAPV